MDLFTLFLYLILVKKNNFNKYFTLTLFFGCACISISLMNIINIYNNTIIDVKFDLIYLILRSYIYVIEWFQYLMFLKLLKQNKIKLLLFVIIMSSIVIHCHYYAIELYEKTILDTKQYISPFDFILSEFYKKL